MILIVEDDEDTRTAYVDLLEIRGFVVVGAATGAEALAALREQQIDAVLLDLTLPDVDGRDLSAQLRGIVAPRHLPLLALTGHKLAPEERTKFDEVMQKPVDFKHVLGWLTSTLAK